MGDVLYSVMNPTGLNEMKETAEAGNSHLVYLLDFSLIPNGDGVLRTDWVVTGGGLIEPNLADYWVSATYYPQPT